MFFVRQPLTNLIFGANIDLIFLNALMGKPKHFSSQRGRQDSESPPVEICERPAPERVQAFLRTHRTRRVKAEL